MAVFAGDLQSWFCTGGVSPFHKQVAEILSYPSMREFVQSHERMRANHDILSSCFNYQKGCIFFAQAGREFPHFAAFDGFHKALYSGDGDLAILDREDWTDREKATQVFKNLSLLYVSDVYCVLSK